jgi:2-oxoglutarate dehydrogenase E1 component
VCTCSPSCLTPFLFQDVSIISCFLKKILHLFIFCFLVFFLLGGDASNSFVAPPSISGGEVPAPRTGGGHHSQDSGDTAKTLHLIAAFQRRGHEMASLDPLNMVKIEPVRDLDPFTYGFTEADWDRDLQLHGSTVGAVKGLLGNADVNNDGKTTLRELHDLLRATYCGNIGVELEAVQDLEVLNWLRSRIEKPVDKFDKPTKKVLLERLAFSEFFETILAKRFGAMKRFGLEGAESMIPGLKVLVDRVTELGVEEIVIGMPHRGRLNVLGNVLRKSMEIIFKEFKGIHQEDSVAEKGLDDWSTSGDVKYHLGSSTKRMYPDGRTVKLELLPNPSHLEAVNPLVVGKARAKVWKNVFIYFISKFALVLFFFVDFGGFVVLWTNM